MKLRHCCTYLLVFLISTLSWSQDIHWSQFNDNPIFQNPGNAGRFNGDYRFVANYRDQWRSVTIPYSTLSISADARIPAYDKLSWGVMLFHDVAGDGQFRTIELQGNLSYLLKLTKDSTHTIRTGFNVGMNHRQLNWDQFYFDNQYNGVNFDPSLPTNEVYQTDRKTNASIGSGLVYEYFKNKRQKISVGIGLFNLNKPNQGFYNEKISRDIRMNVFAKAQYKLDVDWDLLPSLQFSMQGIYRELVAGSSVRYILAERAGTYRAVYAGLWYRHRDAAFVSVGADYQDWFVGLSYDVNFSKLVPASRARGGFEIAVRYILHHFKPKKVLHRVCPDYI